MSQLTEESKEGLSVEALVLTSVHELTIEQPHSSIVPDAFFASDGAATQGR